MANPEHLKILEQGIQAWNMWRIKNYTSVIPDLTNATFEHKKLSRINLNGAKLVGASFLEVDLSNAFLIDADMTRTLIAHTDLTFAKLIGANLCEAVLIDVDFHYTHLIDVNFSDAKMRGAIFGDVNLAESINLESITHIGPSFITINSVYKSGGNIPEKFLRGCGVPEDFITYMRSLTAKAIEFYSCFISYSSKDEEFVKRLYNDLQSEGVRCWFAPEHLKIGDRFRVRIDESIRLYDKLVLVLSENSVSSEWVGDEVEAALEKEEGQGGKVVLFPLRLDSAVMEIKSGWPAKVRRTRHIGDFSDWKNHDSYKKAFERLMRDLKAGG